MKKRRTQSLHFWSHFDRPFPPEDGRNWKRYAVVGKTSAICLSKYVKIKSLSPLPFPGKTQLLFCNIWAFFARKRGRVTNQRVRIKIWQNFVNLYKHFGFNIFQFCSYRSQRTFRKNFNWIFKFGCYSWYQAYVFEKKWIILPHAEFYGESTDNNFNSPLSFWDQFN